MLLPSIHLPPLSRLTHGAAFCAALGVLFSALPSMAETTAADSAAPAATTAQATAYDPANPPPAASPVTCEYGCEDHRAGSEICINRKQHRCSVKGWEPTGKTCAPPPPVMSQ